MGRAVELGSAGEHGGFTMGITNPGPYRARITSFFPQTGMVFPKPAGYRAYPADFTPERKSGNGTIPAADPGWDQTMNKPEQQKKSGPVTSSDSTFFFKNRHGFPKNRQGF